jgi:hypothetical protein
MGSFKRMTNDSMTNPNKNLGSETLDDPHFDSQLIVDKSDSKTNADLVLTLKIRFKEVVPSVDGDPWLDADNQRFNVRAWTPADDFPKWCRDACALAQSTWNEKLWLQTPDYFSYLDWPENQPAWRPNVCCGLRVQVAATDAEAHFQVKVARVDDPRNTGTAVFRSNFQKWKQSDQDTWYFTSKGGTVTQKTVAHEVGHILGLHHIGEVVSVRGCFMGSPTPWGSGNACYASDDSDASLSNNIMGLGMQISGNNATPWQKEMLKYAQKVRFWKINLSADDWKGTASRPAPRSLADVPWKLFDF